MKVNSTCTQLITNRYNLRLSIKITNILKNIHYICLMNLYSSLEIEFKQPFEEVGLDFKNEYTNALISFESFDLDRDDMYEAIRGVLLEILNQYANTKPTTKVGRVGRFLSRIGAVLLKVIKFKINK